MRKYYWYISAFIRKRGALVLISVIIAIVAFSLILPAILQRLNFKKKTYIGVVGRPTFSTLPTEIQNELSFGLTKISEDGSALPSIAERWLVEDEGKTYRFLIKKNLRWQDGKELSPEDINLNFTNVQIVRNVNEVIFKLPEAFAPFPTVVAQPLFRIVHEPYLLFFHRQKVLGLNTFQVIDFQERNSRLTELRVAGPREEKVYRFYLSEQDAIEGFKRGEVDVLPNFSSPMELSEWQSVEIQSAVDKQSILGIFFNTNDPLFSSKEVRQALDYALPKPTGDTQPKGPISPTSWAYANLGKSYDFDLTRATERLLSNPPAQPMHFALTVTPLHNDDAEQVKKNWQILGERAKEACQKSAAMKDKKICENLDIQVEIRVSNFPDTTNFQALLVGQRLPVDPDQYALWHSDQETNFTNYSNVRIDSLLEKGRRVTNQEERITIYQDFQQFFPDDAPVIFLRYLNTFEIRRR